jgi:alginate O-acetyltransferase complex protein AlgJ
VRDSRPYQYAFLALFFVFSFTPLGVAFYNWGTGPGTQEEEARAPTPQADWSALIQSLRGDGALASGFLEAAKKYFLERYGLKDQLIRLHSLLQVKLFRTTDVPIVVLGKGDWLFYSGERVLDYHQGREPLMPGTVQRWVDALNQRRAWHEQRKMRYLYLVAPNTHTIYPEFVPVPAGHTRLDQLSEAKASFAPTLPFVDLRPSLRGHKNQALLYFKTDTHWQPAAAFLAARLMAERLGLPPLEGELCPLRVYQTDGGDLARALGLQGDFADVEVWPAARPGPLFYEDGTRFWSRVMNVPVRGRVVIENPSGHGTAVVFRDSYGEALIPWISSMFKRTVWVWTYQFSEQTVLQEKPDVVLEVLVERVLMTIPP